MCRVLFWKYWVWNSENILYNTVLFLSRTGCDAFLVYLSSIRLSRLIRKKKVQSTQESPDGVRLRPLTSTGCCFWISSWWGGCLLARWWCHKVAFSAPKQDVTHKLVNLLQLPSSTWASFIFLFLACFRLKRTCRVSAARLRSRTPSEDWPRSSTNFFVNRPSEVSYRVFSGGDLGAVEERKEGWRADQNDHAAVYGGRCLPWTSQFSWVPEVSFSRPLHR